MNERYGHESRPNPPAAGESDKLKIYFLPNLLTAANLFCGFMALTKIVEADTRSEISSTISTGAVLILLACIFDLFDGRVARMGGEESPFGREFDSLADSDFLWRGPGVFGASDCAERGFSCNIRRFGWFIASVYLICGAFRLARFNCLAAMSGRRRRQGISGFPDSVGGGTGGVADAVFFVDEGKRFFRRANFGSRCRCCCCSFRR